jgi:capsular polysaccharide biosynthesis protein
MELELDLRDYIKIIRKRIWLIAIIVVVSCLSVGILSYFFIQPTYEASTKLIVNKSDDRQGALNQVDINTVNLNIRLIDTYKEIIKTPRIMDKVVQEHPEFNLTTDQLIKRVEVNSVNNTQVMTLVVQDKSYEKAANIVNAVSKAFQNEIPSIMKVDNVSLLNEAKLSDHPQPVKPNPELNIAISLVVSLMIALGITFLLEYLDDTIKTEEDIQAVLGLPTLTAITRMKEEDMQHQGSVSHKKQVGEVSNVAVHR